jgi:hypothetical protein
MSTLPDDVGFLKGALRQLLKLRQDLLVSRNKAWVKHDEIRKADPAYQNKRLQYAKNTRARASKKSPSLDVST